MISAVVAEPVALYLSALTADLQVRLHRAALPGNLVTEGILLHSDGKTEGIEEFLALGTKYESMVMSTPWLMSYIRSPLPRPPDGALRP